VNCKLGGFEAFDSVETARMLMRCTGILVAIVVLLFPARSALAEVRAADINWTCWHDNAKAVICQLSSIASAYQERIAGPMGDGMAHVSGSESRNKSPSPLASAILHNPAGLTGRRIAIPMFSEPEDRDFMIQLAEAVMCGVKSNCSVLFVGVSEVALLLDEVDDPALN